MNDLSPECLSAAFAGRQYEFHPQIASTNDRAMTLLNEGAPAGTVILAEEQTRGRGRLGRIWHSPPGSALMLSYLVRPSAEAVGDAGMLAALAVCEAIEAMGVNGVGIKWPNDVQIAGRKVCGVLPESAWQGDSLMGVILGIGVNVRIDFSGSPLADTAINLKTVIDDVDRCHLLVELLNRLDAWSLKMGSDGLFEAWRKRLNMIGKTVSVEHAGAVMRGVAEDVARDGALLVRGSDGIVRRAVAGDIALG